MLADFVNRADVRVVQRGGGARLSTEAFQGLGILSYLVRQEFEGYKTPQLCVFGLIDNAHASAA
jgi:hypothetical protein